MQRGQLRFQEADGIRSRCVFQTQRGPALPLPMLTGASPVTTSPPGGLPWEHPRERCWDAEAARREPDEPLFESTSIVT